ncbi:MAG: MAPEG family protein [Nostoc sp. SerVER01]|nr:MAPEG family protein [Nostoc sp. SerVER01]MDZ8024001.1 MAPEG family protein [Nostoc sp. DedQUE11]MDZ8074296.1 MAPEG family protein [Nostoc sp. DedQUE01]MDZ8081517.1 MAPEG family protein [Nostoc sp. DcaGUA01]
MSIPVTTFFVGLNGLIAFALSYIVVMERTKTRIWHGETEAEVINQPNYLENPNPWAAFVESYTQKSLLTKTADDGVLQRKVRAYGNFTEYVPLALLFIMTLEFMHSSPWMLWLIGSALTVGRIAHAWGLITTYGPSPGRAIGFFLTWFVYIIGAAACIYYGTSGLSH